MRLALCSLLLTVAASAQPVVLAPGHPDLRLAEVEPETGVLAVRMMGAQPRVEGTVRDDVALAGDVLTVVTSTEVGMAGPALRDSTRMAWPSLAPLAQVVETDGKRGTVAYQAAGVSGDWGDVGAPNEIAFDLERPVFAPAALPLVVRALPLDQTGYQAVVPLFSARERFQEAQLTVAGPETVTLDDGRTLETVAVDQVGGGGLTRGFAQRHLIDPETRRLVRTTLTPPGMSIQVDPLPAEIAATVRPLRARPPAPPVALVPGHSDLETVEFLTGEATMEMRQSQPEERAMWHITETTKESDGLLEVVMRGTLAGDSTQTVRDTLRVAWPSLAPVSRHRVLDRSSRNTVVRLDYSGGAVAGSYGDAAAPSPIDLALPTPVFDARSITLVARALPLRTGYTATVPLFDAFARLETRTLTVVGREPVETADGTVSAWIIEAQGEGPTRRYAIHPDTRDLLSTTYSPSLGAVVETVRQ